jgi:hypothetical protein
MAGCGDGGSGYMRAGSSGGGSGGSGAEDAQVPLDGGAEDAGPSAFGTLSVEVNDVAGMQGKQVLVEVLDANSLESIGGACAPVTSDPFSVTLPATLRLSVGLCDYGSDTAWPIGDYIVNVQVQQPEIFPSILCTEVAVTVAADATTVATVDTYRSCTDDSFQDGVYDGSALTCRATMQPLVHTANSVAAMLLDFTGATATLERNGTQWLETYADADCRLEVTREIMMEMSGVDSIGFTSNRTFVFTPPNCTLTATGADGAIEVGASAPVFQPSTDFRIDDLWFFNVLGNAYSFWTVLGGWTVLTPPLAVPCGAQDSIARTWTRR